ncbi:MAG: molybdopterin cofactor-binding domain-containing protein, partial [Burkholderiales bacterium]
MRATINQGRRSFLKVGAAAGGGLVIGFHLPGVANAAAEPAKLNAYVKIGTDSRVTFVCGQVEMGQGVHNGLSMLLAEELEVDLKNVRIEQGGIDPAFGNPRY